MKTAFQYNNNNLGQLVAKAKEGGIGSYAFKIDENQSSVSSSYDKGELLENSYPYWNLYSRYSGGEFYKKGNELHYRLKKDYGRDYVYQMGSFLNYNHTAQSPVIECQEDVFITANSGTYSTTYLEYEVMMGNYYFEDIVGHDGNVGIALKNSSGTVITQGYISYMDNIHTTNYQIRWQVSNAQLATITDGLLLYPNLFLTESGVYSDSKRFFIPLVSKDLPYLYCHVQSTTQPVFQELYFYTLDGSFYSRGDGLEYTDPTLTYNQTSVQITNITLEDYISPATQKKYLQWKKTTDLSWSTAIQPFNVRVSTTPVNATFSIAGGLQYGGVYMFRIIESDSTQPPTS